MKRPGPASRSALLPFLSLALGAACDSNDAAEAPSGAPSAAAVPELTTDWQKPRDSLLETGDEAPNFVALAHTGHQIRLDQFLHRPSVVYFYPADDTPGCTAEAEAIRDAWLRLREKVGMVLGVSTDDNVSHRAFAAKHDLPFLLVSDVDHAIARSFGVPIEDGRAARVSFVIDTDRKVTRVFDSVKPEGHAAELEAAVDEISK